MSKYSGLILGLVLVLVFASAANADFSLSGSYELRGKYDMVTTNPDNVWKLSTEKFEIKVKVSTDAGPASADLTYRLANATGTATLATSVDTANFIYELTDAIAIGVSYQDYEGEGFKIMKKDDELIKLVSHWTLDPVIVAKGTLTYKAGSLTVYTAMDTPFEFAATGSYKLDPVTLTGWVGYNKNKETQFLAKAVYPVMKAVTATGEYLYAFNGNNTVGLRVDYRPSFSSYAKVFYNIDQDIMSYKVWGELPIIQNVVAYGWYEDGFFTVGGKYVFGGPNAFIVEYPQKDKAIYFKLSMSF